MQMVVDVELGVIGPGWMVDVEGCPEESLAEDRDSMESADDVLPERFEGVSVGHGAWIEHDHARHMHVNDAVLHVEKRGVCARDSLHRNSLPVNWVTTRYRGRFASQRRVAHSLVLGSS